MSTSDTIRTHAYRQKIKRWKNEKDYFSIALYDFFVCVIFV